MRRVWQGASERAPQILLCRMFACMARRPTDRCRVARHRPRSGCASRAWRAREATGFGDRGDAGCGMAAAARLIEGTRRGARRMVRLNRGAAAALAPSVRHSPGAGMRRNLRDCDPPRRPCPASAVVPPASGSGGRCLSRGVPVTRGPSAYYEPLRHPIAPSLSLTGLPAAKAAR